MSDNVSAFDAAEYDRKIRQTVPFYDEMVSQAAGLVKTVFHAPVSWLDVGCGTGKMADTAMKQVKAERFVFCDVSEKMLRIARQRFDGPEREFVLRDVREMTFDGEFDVVTSVMVFHFLQRTDRLEALGKCFDALRPGGVLISFSNFAPFTETGKTVCLERWGRYQTEQGKSPEESRSHIARYGKAYYPLTPFDEIALLKASGFRTAEILWLSNMQIGVWGMK
ncbi:MAG: class I SAM-dependent methyltransferase [Clostridia bacterium]|nr:class I SAM-dependent methyltransferase [Clostridia bacterium]